MIELLPPLAVVVPLAVAALLLLLSHVLPNPLPDAIATATALAVLAATCAIAVAANDAPLVYWFGNWAPRGQLVIGIGFVASQADAIVAALAALLFAATFVFAWSYFEDIRTFFHVLMLLFLAAMEGFCFTHDLFNLFVWFEVMSVTAFALTAYRLEPSPLEGALNFTITNSLAGFLMLGGIGLLYVRIGALDFGALGRGVAASPHDPVALGAFCLLASGLLIKAAMTPFQFWLADAHAVAPSPVSVIFSGAMVPLGVFGLAKVYWEIFAPMPAVGTVMHTVVLGIGAVSVMLGGIAALRQRHIKRLLAFSTISHVGLLMCATALLTPRGMGGMLAYLVGHGLIKGASFMVAGILLATLGGIDELGLRGRGREIWPAGIAMAIAGLLLGGAPIGLLDQGAHLVDGAATDTGQGWLLWPMVIGTACTGAAVLRATGRIFLGWGEMPGEEKAAPSEEEQEAANRPLWLMMLPVVVLLGIALVCGLPAADRFADSAAARFIAWDPGASLGQLGAVMPIAEAPPPHPFAPWLALGLALLIAAQALALEHLPRAWTAAANWLTAPLYAVVDWMHNGVIGDYVAWIVVGLAIFSLGFVVIGP
jgi:multicomponent Na+:H+ antiporter subunit D